MCARNIISLVCDELIPLKQQGANFGDLVILEPLHASVVCGWQLKSESGGVLCESDAGSHNICLGYEDACVPWGG